MSTGNQLAEALRPLIAQAAAGWSAHFGYVNSPLAGDARYVVVKPAGGPAAELVRRPTVTVTFAGATADAVGIASSAAEEFARLVIGGGAALAYASVTEPVVIQLADGRPVAEVSVSAIVSL